MNEFRTTFNYAEVVFEAEKSLRVTLRFIEIQSISLLTTVAFDSFIGNIAKKK